jgi:two-component system chemotaxis response regulator CheY/putative two-component system response regulator
MNKKKVLIIDDDATNRKLLKTILNLKGYEVLEAENGVQGLDMMDKDVGIVFLDLIMPLMDGIKFLETIKTEKQEFSNIPVIVLTTDDSKKMEALAAGAKEVIIKPINPSEIMEKVLNYL